MTHESALRDEHDKQLNVEIAHCSYEYMYLSVDGNFVQLFV